MQTVGRAPVGASSCRSAHGAVSGFLIIGLTPARGGSDLHGMPPDYRTRLPASTVRDLLGIARALYRAAKADPTTPAERLGALERIGKELRGALELALKCEPDTVGHRAAWSRSERATTELCQLMGTEVPGLLATALVLKR